MHFLYANRGSASLISPSPNGDGTALRTQKSTGSNPVGDSLPESHYFTSHHRWVARLEGNGLQNRMGIPLMRVRISPHLFILDI